MVETIPRGGPLGEAEVRKIDKYVSFPEGIEQSFRQGDMVGIKCDVLIAIPLPRQKIQLSE